MQMDEFCYFYTKITMYKSIVRPLLFRLNPEPVHHLVATSLKVGLSIPGMRRLLRSQTTIKHPLLEREVFGIKFPSPVGLAAGFDKNATLISEMDALGFGFIEIGTVTPLAQPGNPKPRSFRLPQDSALINRMGFNNKGLIRAITKLQKRRKDIVVGGNIGKNTLTSNADATKDYVAVFEGLYPYVDYFVVNVSCPNIANLGALQEKDGLSDILEAITTYRASQAICKPILLKVSPDLTPDQLYEQLESVKKYSIDGVIATNTTRSREGLTTDNERIEAIGNGGLSGKPLFNQSLEMVRLIANKTEGKLPIVAVGGIMSEQDALDMLDAGASLIQIYTGFIYNGPLFTKRINKAILKRELSIKH